MQQTPLTYQEAVAARDAYADASRATWKTADTAARQAILARLATIDAAVAAAAEHEQAVRAKLLATCHRNIRRTDPTHQRYR